MIQIEKKCVSWGVWCGGEGVRREVWKWARSLSVGVIIRNLVWKRICVCGFKWPIGYGKLFKTPGGKVSPGTTPVAADSQAEKDFCVSLFPGHWVWASFELSAWFIIKTTHLILAYWLFFPAFLFPQAHSACVFMFLLSIHGDLQLGKYSVYNTLCLQLTLLINCNRNTAISSLIAGRIQLYISSLSRIQKLWLPNFQRRRRGSRKFSI